MVDCAREVETIQYWEYLADRRKESRAFYELGMAYQFGTMGKERSIPHSVENFRRAAATGHPEAMAELGRLLALGQEAEGGQRDLHASVALLRRATAAGNPAAMAWLGSLVLRGAFACEDERLPMQYLINASVAGDPDAHWELGQLLLQEARSKGQSRSRSWGFGAGNSGTQGSGGLADAVQHFEVGAQRGHMRSLLSLAALLDDGVGTPRDCARAVQLLKVIAEILFVAFMGLFDWVLLCFAD